MKHALKNMLVSAAIALSTKYTAGCQFNPAGLCFDDAGCGPVADGGPMPTDAGLDALVDAGSDAGDTGLDAMPDAGDPGCLAKYTFSAAAPLEDSCGMNDLTDNGTVSVAGQDGEGRGCNGIGYLSVDSNPSLGLSGSLNVSLSIRPNAYPTSGVGYLAGSNDGTVGGRQWYIFLQSDGRLAVGKSADCATDQYAFGTLQVPLGSWTGIRFTYDSGTNTARLYQDDLLDVEFTPGTPGICPLGAGPLTLCADGNGASKFDGSIDNFEYRSD
jgi:hypothetical protein